MTLETANAILDLIGIVIALVIAGFSGYLQHKGDTAAAYFIGLAVFIAVISQ